MKRTEYEDMDMHFEPDGVWFTSDTHFSHWNIIRFCSRPFGSIEEMNDELVRR